MIFDGKGGMLVAGGCWVRAKQSYGGLPEAGGLVPRVELANRLPGSAEAAGARAEPCFGRAPVGAAS